MRFLAFLVSLLSLAIPAAAQAPKSPVLRARIGTDPFEIRFDPWFAGAISGLTFRGKSYVNAADHGRLIQSALSLDGWGECLNPTEAGSVADGRQRRTTSILERQEIRGNTSFSRTRMAFWMPPGAPHLVNPFDLKVYSTPQPCSTDKSKAGVTGALNRNAVSDVRLEKQIEVGHFMANLIRFRLTFDLPSAHRQAVFEPLTAYLEPEFDRFYALEPTGALVSIRPVHSGRRSLIAATSDGKHAMGFASSDAGMDIGAFRWPDTSKLNCFTARAPVARGDHAFECLIAVGTLEEVRRALVAIRRQRA